MPLVKQRVIAAMHEAQFAGPQALAKRAGIATSTIHRLGQGKGPPDTKTLEAIAKETGKSVDWLLGHDEPVPPADLAAALIALAEELRLSRESRADLEQRLAALEPVVKRLAGRALEGSPKRPVPAGTTG